MIPSHSADNDDDRGDDSGGADKSRLAETTMPQERLGDAPPSDVGSGRRMPVPSGEDAPRYDNDPRPVTSSTSRNAPPLAHVQQYRGSPSALTTSTSSSRGYHYPRVSEVDPRTGRPFSHRQHRALPFATPNASIERRFSGVSVDSYVVNAEENSEDSHFPKSSGCTCKKSRYVVLTLSSSGVPAAMRKKSSPFLSSSLGA